MWLNLGLQAVNSSFVSPVNAFLRASMMVEALKIKSVYVLSR